MPWLAQLLLFGGPGAKEAAAACLAELAAVGPSVQQQIRDAGAVQLLEGLQTSGEGSPHTGAAAGGRCFLRGLAPAGALPLGARPTQAATHAWPAPWAASPLPHPCWPSLPLPPPCWPSLPLLPAPAAVPEVALAATEALRSLEANSRSSNAQPLGAGGAGAGGGCGGGAVPALEGIGSARSFLKCNSAGRRGSQTIALEQLPPDAAAAEAAAAAGAAGTEAAPAPTVVLSPRQHGPPLPPGALEALQQQQQQQQQQQPQGLASPFAAAPPASNGAAA